MLPQRSQPAPAPSAPATNVNSPLDSLHRRFAESLSRLGFSPSSKAALAVSGGGDSVALMHLFLHWVRHEAGPPPTVLIVDHGLQDESRDEAVKVAAWAAEQGLDAHVLRWAGAKPRSNLENEARTARYRLLGAWCRARDISSLFVAHTADDQAETFLLRLARGSGVDGLSGMRPCAPLPVPEFCEVQLLRPLLDVGRAELRAYLAAIGAVWFDDPMNDDDRFDRIRIRKLLPALEAAGVPAWRIRQAAEHLARAREALEVSASAFLSQHARLEPDRALIDGASLGGIPREIALRALSAVLLRIGGATYRARFDRLEALLDAVLAGAFAARTLRGCRVSRAPKAQAAFGPATLLVKREAARRTQVSPAEPAQDTTLPPHKGRIRWV